MGSGSISVMYGALWPFFVVVGGGDIAGGSRRGAGEREGAEERGEGASSRRVAIL